MSCTGLLLPKHQVQATLTEVWNATGSFVCLACGSWESLTRQRTDDLIGGGHERFRYPGQRQVGSGSGSEGRLIGQSSVYESTYESTSGTTNRRLRTLDGTPILILFLFPGYGSGADGLALNARSDERSTTDDGRRTTVRLRPRSRTLPVRTACPGTMSLGDHCDHSGGRVKLQRISWMMEHHISHRALPTTQLYRRRLYEKQWQILRWQPTTSVGGDTTQRLQHSGKIRRRRWQLDPLFFSA